MGLNFLFPFSSGKSVGRLVLFKSNCAGFELVQKSKTKKGIKEPELDLKRPKESKKKHRHNLTKGKIANISPSVPTVIGTLKGFDQLMNLVLDDVRELTRGNTPFLSFNCSQIPQIPLN